MKTQTRADSGGAQAPVGRTVAFLLLPWTGLFMVYMALLQVLLPIQVEAVDPANKLHNFGLITGVAAIFAALCNPLWGACSDRTRTRYGRRTPWLVGSMLAGLACLAMLSNARSALAIAVAFSLVQCSMNAFQAVLTAIMPERVPVARRGMASAMIGLGMPFGTVLGTAAASHYAGATGDGYVAVGLAFALCVALFVLFNPDRSVPPARQPAPRLALRHTLQAFFSALSHGDFRWTFISRFCMTAAYFLLGGFMLYLLQDHVQLGPGRTPTGALVAATTVQVACMTLATVAGGLLSDYLKRRRVLIMAGAMGMALAALLLLALPSYAGLMVFSALNGAAFGVYLAVDQALITEVLPAAETAARDLGIMNIASAGPQILTPFLAAHIVGHMGGYPSLMIAAALAATASALAILGVRKVR